MSQCEIKTPNKPDISGLKQHVKLTACLTVEKHMCDPLAVTVPDWSITTDKALITLSNLNNNMLEAILAKGAVLPEAH